MMMLLWRDFTAGDLVKDLYSEPVNEALKLSLDALYGKYDKEDREIFIKYAKLHKMYGGTLVILTRLTQLGLLVS